MARSRPHFTFSLDARFVRGAMLRLASVAALFLVSVSGCTTSLSPPGTVRADSLTERTLDDAPDGLSGLAFDSSGSLWSVAESGVLVTIDPNAGRTQSTPTIGLPSNVELESVSFLKNGDLVLGTEGEQAGRKTDSVFFARRDGTIYDEIKVEYQMWDLKPPRNQGLEGVCVSGDWLVVAAEPPTRIHGRRFAALALYQFSTKTWRPVRMALTSKVGKVSGITCRETTGGIEITAIERHFGVCHIIRAVIDPSSTADSVVSALVLDLSGRRENFEGVAWLDASTLALVTDNFFGGERFGPGRLVLVTLRR